MKRKGKFWIRYNAIRWNPEAVRAVMGEVIVVRAEYMVMEDKIEYMAYSDHFDECEPGIIVPEYEVVVLHHHGHREASYKVRFKKVGNFLKREEVANERLPDAPTPERRGCRCADGQLAAEPSSSELRELHDMGRCE